MNLREASSFLRAGAFHIFRAVVGVLPGGRMSAFGPGRNKIASILVINLDRQPKRWKSVSRELGRFRTHDGEPLTSIVRRLAAVDARDGRAVAATADVDTAYSMRDQLFVQPDCRLAECFGLDEPIKMTRQEVAVARSHIEAWKAIANGTEEYVLVLEDDVWFRRGAAHAIDRGWRAAQQRCGTNGAPHLLYLSYRDAGGTAERVDVCSALFRPVRGLWFLSGYVLSRKGAASLLRAMPVVGPVDLWINYRFEQLGALALAEPMILQREHLESDNSYSVLPYLARAGIVDSGSGPMRPDQMPTRRVLAWTAGGEMESLAMALSMLGLRVRAFDGDEKSIDAVELLKLFDTFDALVDPPLAPDALSAAIGQDGFAFVAEADTRSGIALKLKESKLARLTTLDNKLDVRPWAPLCELLGLTEPIESFPVGTPRSWKMFRDGRPSPSRSSIVRSTAGQSLLDDSPWTLPAHAGWEPRDTSVQNLPPLREVALADKLLCAGSKLRTLVETFPGNLASFAKEGLAYGSLGTQLTLSKAKDGPRPYRSGAFASVQSFGHGRFQVEIKAASGPGLITGFFLHRESPRQEIDVELPGNDPRRLLVNVYFNPGDEGAALGFGYRGSPCRIELGFDATEDFHLYAIDWRPGAIIWSVDGRIVHERVGWDPTPIPHLPMRLHANLWAPRSSELAGRLNDDALPTSANFRNLSISI